MVFRTPPSDCASGRAASLSPAKARQYQLKSPTRLIGCSDCATFSSNHDFPRVLGNIGKKFCGQDTKLGNRRRSNHLNQPKQSRAVPVACVHAVAGVLVVEAVNLGATIFDTNDISAIRGSSLALLRMVDLLQAALDNVAAPAGHRSIILTRGASSLELAITGSPSAETDAYLRKLELAAKSLVGSTVALATAHASTWANQIDFTRFTILTAAASARRAPSGLASTVQLLSLARADLLRSQMQSLAFPLPLEADLPNWAGPTAEFELGPGFWPITAIDAAKGASQSVARRRAFGRFARQEVIPRFLATDSADTQAGWAQRLSPYEFSNELTDLCPTPAEIQRYHLPEAAKGKLALVHLDGNHFGKRRAAIFNPADKAQFSQKLRQVQARILNAVVEAAIGADPVPGMLFEGESKKLIRLECLMIGGDEMLLVVPAFAALQLAERMQQAMANMAAEPAWFGIGADARELAKLTHSMAIVIAPHKLPIRQLRDMGESLLTLTKSRSNGRTGMPLGILVIEGFAAPHHSAAVVLRQRYGIAQDGEALANAVTFEGGDGITAKWPDQLEDLQKIAAAVRPSQLHRLLELEQGPSDRAALEKELSAIGIQEANSIANLITGPSLGGRVGEKWMALHHLRQLGDFLRVTKPVSQGVAG